MNEFFFEDEEVMDLLSHHSEKLMALQEREAKRIMRSYKRVRQDLRDRLDVLDSKEQGETYSAHRVRSALTQVEMALRQMEMDLVGDLGASSREVSERGIQDLITELESWNKHYMGAIIPIDLDSVRVAEKASEMLFNRHDASIKAYTAFQRQEFQRGLTDAIISQKPYSEVVSDIGRYMMAEEWRLERLVRTELHNVYSQGKMAGMNELQETSMPDLKKTLFHPMDKRTGKDSKRLAQNNPVVGINEYFIEDSTGKVREYLAPPNRPNDRAILVPFRESWKDSK